MVIVSIRWNVPLVKEKLRILQAFVAYITGNFKINISPLCVACVLIRYTYKDREILFVFSSSLYARNNIMTKSPIKYWLVYQIWVYIIYQKPYLKEMDPLLFLLCQTVDKEMEWNVITQKWKDEHTTMLIHIDFFQSFFFKCSFPTIDLWHPVSVLSIQLR